MGLVLWTLSVGLLVWALEPMGVKSAVFRHLPAADTPHVWLTLAGCFLGFVGLLLLLVRDRFPQGGAERAPLRQWFRIRARRHATTKPRL